MDAISLVFSFIANLFESKTNLLQFPSLKNVNTSYLEDFFEYDTK